MRQALWIWRQFPRQIASDLRRHYRLHIKHWHRGTRGPDGDLLLSSYELLELLEHLPEDDSAFKAAAERGGRWPSWKKMLAEATNQSYRMHASYLAAHGVEVGPTTDYEFVDPVEREAREKAAQAEAEADAQRQARFEAEIGFCA